MPRRLTSPTARYLAVLLGPALVGLAVVVALVAATLPSLAGHPFAVAGLLIAASASAVLGLSGLQVLASWAALGRGTQLLATPLESRRPLTAPRTGASRVALLYCTIGDLDLRGLRASMAQTVPVRTVLLDDSTDPEDRARVDAAAALLGCEVLRRETRAGYKAGNLNSAIATLGDTVDAVVILDTDTVLPPDFVEHGLRRLHDDPTIGVVQARVRAVGGSVFARAFGGLLGSHLSLTLLARDRLEGGTFHGRGAMVRMATWRAAGGIPELVMEDLAFTVAAWHAGYRVVAAPKLLVHEDYPVDAAALRVQQRKYVEGAIEFVRTQTARLRTAPVPISARLDLWLTAAMVPAAAVAGPLLLVGALLLATATTTAAGLPPWLAVGAGLGAVAPVLPEALRLLRARHPLRAAGLLAATPALYSSMLVPMLAGIWRATRGAAHFAVTPKRPAEIGRGGAVRAAVPELLLAAGGAAAALTMTGSPLLAMPLLSTAAVAIGLAWLGGRTSLAPSLRGGYRRLRRVPAVASMDPSATVSTSSVPVGASATERSARPSGSRAIA